MSDREPTDFPADTVHSDNVGGARLAARHLLASGHRRIALLIDRRNIWTARERERGFLEALAEYDVPVSSATIIADLSDADAAERVVMTMLGIPDAPTAIVSGQNLITVGAAHALRKLGRHHDVALVGFDDLELADLLDPGLSVVAQRPQELGRTAADRLFASLDAGKRLEPAHLMIPVDLIPRGSGEIRPPAAGVRRAH